MKDDLVAVLHGAGADDESEFSARVAELNDALGQRWRLVPIFWSDAAATPGDVAVTIPRSLASPSRSSVSAPRETELEAGMALLKGDSGRGRNGESVEALVQGAVSGLGSAKTLRGAGDVSPLSEDDLRRACQDQWPRLSTLSRIRDHDLLRRSGRLAAMSAEQAVDRRGSVQADAVEEWRDRFTSALQEVDQLLESVIGRVGSELNRSIREALMPGIAKVVGDIVAYQRHQDRVQERTLERMHKKASGWGTSDHPARVLAHSLGGIIAFDLATRATNPLHVDTLVTFGSQPAWLHVVDPRGGLVQPYAGTPLDLPPNIRTWVNLWEGWDVLAFAASTVFDPAVASDVEIPHSNSAGLWTHSTYWASEVVIDKMRLALGGSTSI